MVRWFGIGACCALALAIGGCRKRPLAQMTTTNVRDGSTMGVDAGLADAPPAEEAPRDAPRAEAPAADTVSLDAPSDAGDTPSATDTRTDTGLMLDGGATDTGAAPDGACAAMGNGQPPQKAPLFGAAVKFPIPDGANGGSVAIGDVTGDGRLDVLVGSQLPALLLYAQTADGDLAPPVSFPLARDAPLHPEMIELGDVNGDRRLDVAFPRDDGVGLMLGDGAGGFGPEQRLPTLPFGGGTGYVVAIADLNGDGRADIVSASWGSEGVNVYYQDAAGALMPPRFFACPHGGYESIAVGDADGDGLNDVAISGSQQNHVCVLLQRPEGFSGLSVPVGVSTDGVAIGNFGGGDCGPAIAFATGGNRPAARLGVVRWTGSGTFSGPTFVNAYDIPGSMVAADLDGDRRTDIAVMHVGWEAIGVFRGLATGGLATEETYAYPYINWGPDRLAVGDVNGDGRPDLVSADRDLGILYHR